jgi:hypothetical protein
MKGNYITANCGETEMQYYFIVVIQPPPFSAGVKKKKKKKKAWNYTSTPPTRLHGMVLS